MVPLTNRVRAGRDPSPLSRSRNTEAGRGPARRGFIRIEYPGPLWQSLFSPRNSRSRGAMLRGALLCIACTVAASSWPQWPDQPLSKGETVGVEGEHLAAPQVLQAHRKLAEVQAPSSEETALYHIIAWSSLMMVVVFFFASMALCNMQVESDSLLYSKAKAD